MPLPKYHIMRVSRFLFLLPAIAALQFASAQPVADPSKKATRKKIKKEAIIYNDQDLKKFEEEWRQDSIRMIDEWKKEFRVDSLRLVEQVNKAAALVEKTYKEKWNPTDSLKYIDDKTKKLFAAKPASLDEVINIINKNFTNPLHRTRAVFYWIATHIRYDWEAYSSGIIQSSWDYKKDAYHSFESGKGVCDHYSSLFQYMIEQCGIEVKKISGHSKIWPDARVNTSRTDHAWNAVKINGRWKLMDVTWASEKDDDMEYFWFDTPPEKFIYSHFPSDSSFQLLKNKMTLDEYAQMPVISKYFFLSGAPVTIPFNGYYANNSGLFQLEMKSKSNRYRIETELCRVTLTNERRFTGDEMWQKIPVSVLRQDGKDTGVYSTVLPGKGAWWIKVNLFEKINSTILPEVEFPTCMIFQVSYH